MGGKRGPVTVYPRTCLGTCGRTIRPSRTLLADYPNTVSLVGLGRCKTCRDAMSHNGHARQPEDQRTVDQNRASVERWLRTHWRPANRMKVVR